MKISIVVPTWNSELYLPSLFECVIAQETDDVEVIIADNLSLDKTEAVVKYYSQFLNVLFVSERDHGQSEAVTKGLQRASGEILHWHAADDFILKGALNHVLKIFRRSPKTDLVFSDGLAYKNDWPRLVSSWSTLGLTRSSMLRVFGRFQSDTAYWRTGITKFGLPLRDDIPLMVDEDFFVKLVISSRIIERSSCHLGVFRVRPGQVSSNKVGVPIEDLRHEFRYNYIQQHRHDAQGIRGLAEYGIYKAATTAGKITRLALRKLGHDAFRTQYEFVVEMERRAQLTRRTLGIS